MFDPVIDARPTPVQTPVISDAAAPVSPTGAPIFPPWLAKFSAPIVLAAGAAYVEKDELLALGVSQEWIKFAAIVVLVIGPTLAILSPGARKRKRK